MWVGCWLNHLKCISGVTCAPSLPGFSQSFPGARSKEPGGSRGNPCRVNSHRNFSSACSPKCPAWTQKHLKTTAIRQINCERCGYRGRAVKIAFAKKVSVVVFKTGGRGWWEKCQWCFLCDSLNQISHVQRRDTRLKGHKPQAQNFTFCAHLGFFPEGDLPPLLHHHLQHEDPWGKIWHRRSTIRL